MIGEDAVCCAIGEKMVLNSLPEWGLSKSSINTGGITKLVAAIPRYVQHAAHVQPVLCVADTDGKCPVDLVSTWLPAHATPKFLLRLAVSEAESWALADRVGFAQFFSIGLGNLPQQPDTLLDPKREVLRLARISRVRLVRQEMVSALDPNKRGVGYNTHLCRFIREKWVASRASERSTSLGRALARLADFGLQMAD